MDRIRKSLRKNDNGAALVMVIVTIAVVSIFATVILYMTTMNFYMKTNDMKNRKSFYQGEEALEQIKASLMPMVSEAYKKAIDETLCVAGSMDAATIQSTFRQKFFTIFQREWFEKAGAVDEHGVTVSPTAASVEAYLKNSVLDSRFSGDAVSVEIQSGGIPYEISTDNSYFIIKTIKLEFTDSDGYTTILSTDYRITAPELDYSALGGEGSIDSSAHADRIKLIECVNYVNWKKE